ncbi:hypothetical protein ACROYT_G003915 [Oculina patagonica]
MKLSTLDFVLLPSYAVIVIVGLTGNSLILTVVKRKRYMHTTTNFLLANLALADLLTLLWCIPGIALNGFVRHPDGLLGDILCKFITMNHIAGISLLVAGLTLTLVSVERYNALVNPLKVNLRLTLGNVKYAIAIMWIFGFIFVLPLFVVEDWDETRRHCIMTWEKPFSTIYWSFLATVVITSFLVVCFCYFNIIRGLYFTKKICAENLTSSSQEETQAKRKIVKLSITITVIFMACFFPYVVATVIDISTKAENNVTSEAFRQYSKVDAKTYDDFRREPEDYRRFLKTISVISVLPIGRNENEIRNYYTSHITSKNIQDKEYATYENQTHLELVK